MSDDKEIKLIVKANTYKEIRNLLHNEYGVTKEDIEKIIIKMVENFIVKQMEDVDSYLSKKIVTTIKEILNYQDYWKNKTLLDEIVLVNLKDTLKDMITPEIIIESLKKQSRF